MGSVGPTGPDDRVGVTFPSTGYFRFREPREPGSAPAPLLLAVHGYGQIPDEMLDYAVSVAPPGWAVLAPEAPSSFYRRPHARGGSAAGGVAYGWIADPRRQDARNDALVDACLAKAAEDHAIDRSRVCLLGYSQGVAVALHWWTTHPDRAVALVGLAGGFTASLRPRLARLASRRVLWVTGDQDTSYPPAYTAGMVEALRDAGVAFEDVMLPSTHAILEPARQTVETGLRSI